MSEGIKRKYKRKNRALYLDDIQLIYLQGELDNIEHPGDRLKEVLRQEILIRIEAETLFRERTRLESNTH